MQCIHDFLLADSHLVVGLLIDKHHFHAGGVVSSVHEIAEKTNAVRIPTFQLRPIKSELSRKFLDLTLLEGS